MSKYSNITELKNVRVKVPKLTKYTRVGTINGKNNVKKLGTGVRDVEFALTNGEKGLYVMFGMPIDRTIVNRSFYNIGPEDIGKNGNFNVTIRDKKVGSKIFTSMRYEKVSDGKPDKEIKFGSKSPVPGAQQYPIQNTKSYVKVYPFPAS